MTWCLLHEWTHSASRFMPSRLGPDDGYCIWSVSVNSRLNMQRNFGLTREGLDSVPTVKQYQLTLHRSSCPDRIIHFAVCMSGIYTSTVQLRRKLFKCLDEGYWLQTFVCAADPAGVTRVSRRGGKNPPANALLHIRMENGELWNIGILFCCCWFGVLGWTLGAANLSPSIAYVPLASSFAV